MKIERFFQLQDLMKQAFQEEEFQEAKSLALEYLDMANSNKTNWNYGNAIHQANLILGRISLREKKIEEAKIYLLKAGKTPGSPQLNSFGPNMTLAKELLEIEETETVLEYFNLCKKFWYKIISWYKIRKWKKIIKKGSIPDFRAHLIY
ncbi:MAG: hypothetical protein AB8F94_05255 [Saprospiraceae bacterium]